MVRNWIYLAVLVFGFVVGQLVDFNLFKAKPVLIQNETPKDNKSEDEILAKFQKLTDQDISEYYRLKSMEERYKKADEILGKIMTIFLADLGLKVSQQTLEDSKRPLPQPAPPASPVAVSAPIVETPTPAPAPKPPAKPVTHLPETLAEVPAFLEKKELKDLGVLNPETNFNDKAETMAAINGVFGGKAGVVLQNEPQVWDIEMDLRGRIRLGELFGRLAVKITGNGKVISQGRDRGDIDSFKDFPADENALVLQAGPYAILQLYYLSSLDVLVGNVYYRDKTKNLYVPVGTTRLARLAN